MKTASSNPSSRMASAAQTTRRRCGRFAPLCVLGLLLIALAGGEGRSADRTGGDSDAGVSAAEPPAFPVAHIYFADPSGRYLQAEERIFTGPEMKVDRGRSIVEALIKGPKSGLIRTIPVGTQLRGFYLASGNRAYVDFSEHIVERYPGGCKSEILTLYSIVNSLILNLPEVATVKILVGGRDVPTLAGHIDIRNSFTADMSLIR